MSQVGGIGGNMNPQELQGLIMGLEMAMKIEQQQGGGQGQGTGETGFHHHHHHHDQSEMSGECEGEEGPEGSEGNSNNPLQSMLSQLGLGGGNEPGEAGEGGENQPWNQGGGGPQPWNQGGENQPWNQGGEGGPGSWALSGAGPNGSWADSGAQPQSQPQGSGQGCGAKCSSPQAQPQPQPQSNGQGCNAAQQQGCQPTPPPCEPPPCAPPPPCEPKGGSLAGTTVWGDPHIQSPNGTQQQFGAQNALFENGNGDAVLVEAGAKNTPATKATAYTANQLQNGIDANPDDTDVYENENGEMTDLGTAASLGIGENNSNTGQTIGSTPVNIGDGTDVSFTPSGATPGGPGTPQVTFGSLKPLTGTPPNA